MRNCLPFYISPALLLCPTLAMDYPFHGHQNPNPNNCYSHFTENKDPQAEFQVSDYLLLDDGFEDDDSSSMVSSEQLVSGSSTGYSTGATSRNTSMQVKMIYTQFDYSLIILFLFFFPK